MATIIPPTGDPYEVVPADGVEFTLEELQTIVGGYLEALSAPDGRLMYLNEDGKRLNLPQNVVATWHMRGRLLAGDVIVGTVILCSRRETGDDLDEEREEEVG